MSGANYVGELAGLGALISNSFTTGNVSGGSYVGGLAGQGVTISNSYSTGNVSGTGSGIGGLIGYIVSGYINTSYSAGSVSGGSGTTYVGGLVGENYGTISNSYASGNVSGSYIVGGLIGANWGTVNTSYTLGNVSGTGNYVGGLVGYVSTGSINNSYATGNVSGAGSYVGGLIGDNFGAVSNSNASGIVTGVTDVGGLVGRNWGGTVSDSNASGNVNGTTAVGGLVGLSTGPVSNSYSSGHVNGSTGVGGLVGDSSSGTISTSYAIGDVSGSGDIGGLAGYGGTIINSYAMGSVSSVSGGSYIGGLVGYVISSGSVSSSYATGNVSSTGSRVGGLVGDNNGSVSYSHASGSVSGGNNVGGLVGMNHKTVSYSSASGDVNSSSSEIGGLIGMNWYGSVDNSSASGNVNGQWWVGGLVGYNNYGTIDTSHALGNVVGTGYYTGGLVGYAISGSINNSYATGSVTGVNYVGGLVGGGTSAVSNSFATGGVSGNSYVGGLVGDSANMVSFSYASGNVSASGDYAGGLLGANEPNIQVSDSYATGNVSNTSFHTGGLVGYNSGTIINSYAEGNVTSTASFTGGLVGVSDGLVSNSHASGNVSGTNSVGGLEGANLYSVVDSYATGSVSGNHEVGGLVGSNSQGTLSNSFYNVDQVIINGGSSLTVGGIYNAQYQDWISHGETLDIANYSSLTSGSGGYYNVGSIQGLKDMLGFAEDPSFSFRLTASIDLSNAPGFYVPYFSGTFDGNNNTFSNPVVNVANSNVGMFGQLLGSVSNLGLINVNIAGLNDVGGMVGYNVGTISGSYVSGSVSGAGDPVGLVVGYSVGGLVGFNVGSIGNSYATGSVTGDSSVGGLVGTNVGSINTSYAVDNVTGNTNVGGLVGDGPGYTASNNFWDITTSGQSTSAGGTGLSSSQMMQLSSFAGWNIANTGGSGDVWRIYEGHTAPLLTSFLTPLTLTDAPDVTVAYNGAAQSGASTAISGVLGAAATGTNVGSYYGYYSTQQGYDISGGNLTINAAVLNAVSTRAYDGTVYVNANTFTLNGLVNGETLTLSGVGTIAGKDVGTYDVNLGTLSFGNGTGLASNYTFAGGTNTATITARALTVSAKGVNKVYDAGTNASVTLTSNAVAGDVLSTAYTDAAFLDKNVGTGKTINVSGISVGGTDAGNYILSNSTATATASINKLNLAVTGVTANSKVYDGTTAATLGGTAAVTALGGDVVTLGGSGVGVFANKNVGVGKAVTVSGYTISGADAGNYNIIQPVGLTADITALALSLSGTPVTTNKVYDGKTTDIISGATLAGVVSGDTVNLGGLFADKNVGVGKAVSLTLTGTDAHNYSITPVGGLSADITALALSISGTPAGVNKVYDGKTTDTISGASLLGVVAGDKVTLSGLFADKNVGTGKAVTLTLTGTSAGNYSITPAGGLSADITARALTVSAKGVNKVYDAGTNASVTLTSNAVAGDVLSTAYTDAAFLDKNVGTGKTINVSGISVGGTDAGNYILSNSTATATASINKLNLAVTGVTANSKVYDGTTAATLGGTAAVTALGGDVVTLGGSGVGVFANKNVGVGKAVTVSGYTISGADAGNYNIIQPVGLTADITALALSLSGTPVTTNKVYDGKTTDIISGATLAGVVSGDTVNLGGLFADKNVGVGKAVSLTLTGTDAHNYSITPVGGLSADITALALSISGTPAGVNKVYDGKTTDTISGASLLGVVAGDKVTLSGLFADKNVGTGKAVTLTLTGTSAGNYSITPAGGLSADITARALTVSAKGVNKVYDAGTNASVTLTSNAVAGDVLSTAYTDAAFLDKNVGTGKTINVSGISVGGTDAGNYILSNSTATATASINKLNLAVTGVTANSKVYDGTTAATLGGTAAVTALGGDVVTLGGSGVGVFANKNVGVGKAVTVSGYTISGADAGNYNIIQPVGLTADITALALSLSGTPVTTNKVYDGKTTDIISGATLAGVVSGDTVNLGGLFADKNVGVGKAVSLTLTGTDAHNYSITPVGGLSADITALALSISGTPAGVNKVYDGKTTDTISGASLLGVVAGDKVTLSGLFADKNVGTGKAVTLTLTGTSAGNYSITPAGGLSADITARALTVSAKGVNKVYDAGTNASVTLTSNAVAGDVLSTAYTDAAFLDKNVGTGKTINVSGISVGGTDAGNYILSNSTATATASINKLNLAVTGVTANSKVYDGTTAATLGGTAAVTALGGDVVTLGGSGVGVFANKNVGVGKAVTVSGYTISGADAGNYNIIQPKGLVADITARALTITADNITRLYGLSNPLLTYSVGGMGLASGDTLATVFTGALATAAVVSSPAGSYAITQGTLATNSNYIITTFNNGVLTVQ